MVKSTGDMIFTPRNGCNTNRSLSPVTMQFALPATANSRNFYRTKVRFISSITPKSSSTGFETYNSNFSFSFSSSSLLIRLIASAVFSLTSKLIVFVLSFSQRYSISEKKFNQRKRIFRAKQSESDCHLSSTRNQKFKPCLKTI